jgi:hypothetical protein
MASVVTPKRGSLIVKVVIDGTPRHIRVGHRDKKSAHNFARRVESLLSSRLGGTEPSPAVAAWLTTLPQSMRTKLAKAGLIDDTGAGVTLAEHLDSYIARRSAGWKPASLKANKRSRERLVSYFGTDTLVTAIKPSDAEDWRNSFKPKDDDKPEDDDKTLAEATICGFTRHAKSMFKAAVKDKLIADNPFADLASGSVAAEDRRYITAAETDALLDAAPDLQWRLLIGLGRMAALRVPSESHGLRWTDIDFAEARLSTACPKTERFGGHHARRDVPISPQLMAILHDAFDAAPDGSELVVELSTNNMIRNLRVIARRAGLDDPDTVSFQRFRSSCEIDWSEHFPSHVAAAWAGHSEQVSRRHYLAPTSAHFAKAAEECAPESAPAQRRTVAHQDEDPGEDAISDPDTASEPCSTMQNVANQHSDAPGRTRTCGLCIRNALLCPAELRAR